MKRQHKTRLAIAASFLTLGLSNSALSDTGTPAGKISSDSGNNQLISAVAWKQTAAEYEALYHQAYNIARLRFDLALANHNEGDKPLAVITDIDDTILNASNYWGYLINNNQDFFDDDIWDRWVPENQFTAMPGALEFFNYAASQGVEVFYVSSRNQGERTLEYGLANLNSLGFPNVDTDHVTILRDSSNKEPRQHEIEQDYDVILLLGDNLNDFSRKYYVNDIDERASLMEEDRELFGNRFILMPNPTDGHWVSAIFGESEPPANDANRDIFKDAATRSAWQP